MTVGTYQYTKKRQFLYAFGDFGYNFVWTLVSSFLLYFWTDCMGIAAGIAGTIMLLSRVWDAINDPIVGKWADNTKSKHGQYRPWILYAAIPLCLINILCFTSIPIESEVGKIIWAFSTFFVAVLISTMFYIPYTAMLSNLTLDAQERTQSTSYRLMCAYAAAILITRYTGKLVNFFGNGNSAKGYFFTAIAYSVLGFVCWMVTFFNTKEIVQQKVEHVSYRESMKMLAKNKYVWILAMAFVSYGLFNYGRGATAVYYFRYVAGDANKYGTYGLVHYGMSFVGAAIMPKIAAKAKNKGSVPRFAYLMMAILLIAQFFFDPSTSTGLTILLILQAVISVGHGMSSSMLYGMVPDVVDYTQYIHKTRASGFISAVINFMLKMGMAFGAASVGWALAATGYVAGVEQSATTITGLKGLFALMPGLFCLLAFIFLSLYKLDRKTHQDMLTELDLKTNK